MVNSLQHLQPAASRSLGVRRVPALLAVAAVTALAVASPAFAAPDAAPTPEGAKKDRQLWDRGHTAPTGLAASTHEPRLLFAVSGGNASGRIVAIEGNETRNGHYRAVYTLPGVSRFNWQALAAGPDAEGKPSLYIGDIGNGSADGPGVVKVHRLPEPKGVASGTLQATAFHLKYPAGSPSAETMLVHPETGRLYIVTTGGDAALYVAPEVLDAAENNKLTKIGRVPSGITDGTFLADGRVVLRTEELMYVAPSVDKIADAEVYDLPGSARGHAVAAAGADRVLVSSAGAITLIHSVPVPAAAAAPVGTSTPVEDKPVKAKERASVDRSADAASRLAAQSADPVYRYLFYGAFAAMAIGALFAVGSSPLVRPKPRGRRARR